MQPIPAGLRISQGTSSSLPAQRARCAAACRGPAPLLLCAATSHALQSEKDSGASADPNTTLPAGLEDLLYAVTKMVASPSGSAAWHPLFTKVSMPDGLRPGCTVNHGCSQPVLSLSAVTWLQVSMRREKLEFSPVFARNIPHRDPTTQQQHMLGYIRLANFSQKAAHDMDAAIHELQVRCWAARFTLHSSRACQACLSSLLCPCCHALVRVLPLNAQAAVCVPAARHKALLCATLAEVLGATTLHGCQGRCPRSAAVRCRRGVRMRSFWI